MICNQEQKQEQIVNKPQIAHVKQLAENTKKRFKIVKRKVKHQILIRLDSHILKQKSHKKCKNPK